MGNKKPNIPTPPQKGKNSKHQGGYQPNKSQNPPSSPNLPDSGSSTNPPSPAK